MPDDNEAKPQQHDSGVDFSEKLKNEKNVKIRNKKSNADTKMGNGADVQFKSGMIFDLEM